MLQRVKVREGQSAENARKTFESMLGVGGWATPGIERRTVAPRDPKAPWWWTDDEDASDSFLKSMGVTL